MKSVRIRSDFTVKLPDELREQVRPGDTLGVLVSKGKVTFVRSPVEPGLSLREMIERVRRNPSSEPLTEQEIETIVHRTRRRRR
jgi:hypothetical protein